MNITDVIDEELNTQAIMTADLKDLEDYTKKAGENLKIVAQQSADEIDKKMSKFKTSLASHFQTQAQMQKNVIGDGAGSKQILPAKITPKLPQVKETPSV